MKKEILNINWKEIGALLGIYFFLSLIYHITLWFNRAGYDEEVNTLFVPREWFITEGLQYSCMFVGTIVVLFFVFKIFRHWKLKYRLLLHIIGLPFFLLCGWKFFYVICDYYGFWRMEGTGQVWDIYIPALVYLIQFSLIHAYEYYVINQRKIQYEVELKNSVLKSELSAIKAQLNPHFLYNVFNTINASVPKEMEETREMIAELSDLFRYQLKASREDYVTLEEELEFVKKYLKLEQKRFEDRLEINFDVHADLLKRKVPPMILQPLVENSVKHGISPLVKGGRIDIIIKKNHDKLVFEIIDTGVGVANKEEIFNLGVGLSNTQKRLQKMYQSNIKIADNIPSGLKVSFEI